MGDVVQTNNSLRAGLGRGMAWTALQELVDESARAGDQLAAMVVRLDLRGVAKEVSGKCPGSV